MVARGMGAGPVSGEGASRPEGHRSSLPRGHVGRPLAASSLLPFAPLLMPSHSFHPEPRRPGERMGNDPPACRNMMEQEEDCGLLRCLGGWTGLCYIPRASAPACPHRYIPSPPTFNTARHPPPQPSLPRGGSSSCLDVGATTPVQVVPWIGHGCCQQLPCHAWKFSAGDLAPALCASTYRRPPGARPEECYRGGCGSPGRHPRP